MAEPLAAQPAATTPQPAVRRVAVVFNPATSPDDAPERKRDLQAALNAAGVEVVWLETTEQEAGQGLTRQAVEQGVDLVLAAGGDGTVMACVTGLAASGVPLAVLPGGTGNLLALNLDQATSTTRSMSRCTATAAPSTSAPLMAAPTAS